MTNTKTTKRALLSSAVALLICFAMLLGTTFAWFTDSATSGTNQIQAGNLKVDIVDESGTSLVGNNLKFQNKNGETDILWEPGVTFRTQAFKIKNNGNLAFKYCLALNGVTGNAKLLEVIKFSIVKADGTAVDLANFEGTLNTANALSEAYYIQGVMATSAGNEYQGLTLEGVGVTVSAAQLTYETDSFGDQYDKEAKYPVVDAEDLADAIADGKSVKLEGDISLNETIEVVGDVAIDLNGFDMDASALDSAFSVASGSDVTVKIEGTDEEVKLGKNGLVDVAAGADAIIEINGGSFVSDDAGSTLIKPDGDGEIKIVLNDVDYKSTAANGYVLDCSYYDGSNLSVEINGGSFEATTGLLLPEGSSVKGATITAKNTKNMQPAVYAMGDMTIENCIIKAEKSHAVAVAGGATLTIINCEVYAGSDANALAFQVFSSGGTININNTIYNGSYGTTGKMNSGCVAIINIDGVEVYRKG